MNMVSVLLFSEKNITSLIRDFIFINNYKSGWYIISIVILYIVFYFSACITPQMTVRKILFSVGVVCYILCCRILDFPTYWYNSVIAILLGMLFVSNKLSLKLPIRNTKLIILIVLLVIVAGIVPRKLVLEICFVLVLATLVGLYLENDSFKDVGVLKFLGAISYEVYLIHPVCIMFVKTYITNDRYVIAPLVIFFTLILAMGFRKVMKFMGK